MPTIILLLFVSLISQIVDNARLRAGWVKNKTQHCTEVPLPVLETVLGGAYNPRYMSVDKPPEDHTSLGNKRNVKLNDDFYVDDYFDQQIYDEPAWGITNHVELANKKLYGLDGRHKRGLDYLQEWQCKSKVDWIDLGNDYFPRFLRTVVCLTDKCWFSLYKCKPKSFTVKLLRRRRGLCTRDVGVETLVGTVGLPKELREKWVWEERAVTFCCDCSRP